MIADIIETVAATLGIPSSFVTTALCVLLVLLVVMLIFRRGRHKYIVADAVKNTNNDDSWSAASPTNIELPKAIIKQLQQAVADTGKLKALFSKIDKLDTIVSDIEKLKDLSARIDGLDAVVARIEQLQAAANAKHHELLQTLLAKIDTTGKTPPAPPAAPWLTSPVATTPTAAAEQPLTPPELVPVMSEQPVPVAPPQLVREDSKILVVNELTDDLRRFCQAIITKDVWITNELRHLALENNLMHNDAIDKLNEWSNKKYHDDLMIEEDGKFLVQRDILK